MKAIWLTDIHLDFLTQVGCETFFASIAKTCPDVVFLTGDISIAPSLLTHLEAMSQTLNMPIYFVLGNHDFYHGSITEVRAAVHEQLRAHAWLRYLPDVGIVPLTASTALIGHDGWGDSRYGNYVASPVKLNDHVLIKELIGLPPSKLQQRLKHLGDEAASYLDKILPLAFDQYPHVVLLTHVPPFRESCWYQGQTSNDEWLPFFACKAVGDVLRKTMEARPQCVLTVYCGHTHNSGTAKVLPNLTVFTGDAEYGKPKISGSIVIDG